MGRLPVTRGVKYSVRQITEEVQRILQDTRAGIRFSELVAQIAHASPATPEGTIRAATHKYLNESEDIRKISRGFYIWRDFTLSDASYGDALEAPALAVQASTNAQVNSVVEHDFYEPFAVWLREEDEVTVAVPFGRNTLGSKWGTPDVIGVLKRQRSDPIEFPLSVITAEVKVDPNQTIVAFGQAISYRLFSHRTFLVLPDTTPSVDLERIKALSELFGLGLVTFTLDPKAPSFKKIVAAVTAQPDMFYTNDMARSLSQQSRELFDRLF